MYNNLQRSKTRSARPWVPQRRTEEHMTFRRVLPMHRSAHIPGTRAPQFGAHVEEYVPKHRETQTKERASSKWAHLMLRSACIAGACALPRRAQSWSSLRGVHRGTLDWASRNTHLGTEEHASRSASLPDDRISYPIVHAPEAVHPW